MAKGQIELPDRQQWYPEYSPATQWRDPQITAGMNGASQSLRGSSDELGETHKRWNRKVFFFFYKRESSPTTEHLQNLGSLFFKQMMCYSVEHLSCQNKWYLQDISRYDIVSHVKLQYSGETWKETWVLISSYEWWRQFEAQLNSSHRCSCWKGEVLPKALVFPLKNWPFPGTIKGISDIWSKPRSSHRRGRSLSFLKKTSRQPFSGRGSAV